ncbi:sortilin-like isoform X1 [Boleophthalmus pectinirostris]|uniref:sortilin-like isoform X1 n=1 Tax=Boleophthalmus pectinirostris TaxID=150288 RepID=UPI00242D5BA6|nr:sortilin-like isoform X1 [Boleophthalmus pectinirostris]
MRFVSCVLALGAVFSTSLTLGAEFDAKDIAKLADFRKDESARSLGAKQSSQIRQKWERRRSLTGLNDETCTTLDGADSVLQNNTHTFTFKVRTMGSLSLAWVGDGSGVLLVLTTFHVPLFMLRLGQSNLYRSEDYGKTFEDVTHLINHTFIQTEFGIAISPDHSGKVILTGDVSDLGGFKLFRSHDFGLTFEAIDLPFEPLIQMLFNPADCDVLLTLSITLDLWLSEDFGATWRKIHDSVCLVRWGPNNNIFFTTNHNGSCNDKGMLELRRSSDYGRSFKIIATRVYSFVLGGRFVFASIMTGSGTERMIHVSVDGGDLWNSAQLPTVNHEQFYSILSANQELVFMHVDDPGDSGVGTVYVSDDRGTVFSKSLERHLYTTTGSDTDFTVVSSLRGVYMTSILTEDGEVETVITFDQGATWQPLKSPENCDSEASANRPHRCKLHIHSTYSTSLKLNVPMLPLSQSNAVGLIIAHGSIGEGESILSPDVYISDDGGYSWFFALKGPHHYAILDYGGLIVAVEHTNSPVNQIKYSVDEGQCWHSFNFTSEPFHFSGLDSEPGSRSMNLSLWGYRNDYSRWVVITIDLRKVLSRDCTEEDFVPWLSHSDPSGPSDQCVLGFKETFLRLRKGAVCYKGKDYETETKIAPCPCTPNDYHCDFGYYRPDNSSECVEQEELKGQPLEFCLNGTTEQLQTSGYRKIPGDRCIGGFQPERKETDLKRKCINDAQQPNALPVSSSTNTALIVLVIIAILLSSAVTGVWLVKKYICGGRFLVHRYSVMRDNVEANKIEGVDDVDTNYMETGKAQYNEDSDQDLLA